MAVYIRSLRGDKRRDRNDNPVNVDEDEGEELPGDAD